MVLLKVKRDQKQLFAFEASVNDDVSAITEKIVAVNNGRLKVLRICDEISSLCEHGVEICPQLKGLLEEQIKELKLTGKKYRVDHYYLYEYVYSVGHVKFSFRR